MTSEKDKPREPRVAVNREFDSIEAFIAEYVTNVSRTGAFIRSKNPLPVGTEVEICLSVVLDDVETVEGKGRVVRVSEDPPGMGVEFTELTQVSRGLIEALLARRMARRSGPP